VPLTDDAYKEIRMKVRGKKKSYSIVDKIVWVDNTHQVRLVISKRKEDSEPKYYICTDVNLDAKKILSIMRINRRSKLLIGRQIRSWVSRIISFEASAQLRDSCNWFSLFGLEFSQSRWRILQVGRKENAWREG
jgi:hypothetical protein